MYVARQTPTKELLEQQRKILFTRVRPSTVDAPTADAPNVVWAVDSQFDADEQGRLAKSAQSSTSTPGNASAGSWIGRSPPTGSPTTSRTSSPSVALRGPQIRQRTGVHQLRDGRQRGPTPLIGSGVAGEGYSPYGVCAGAQFGAGV